MEGSCLSLKAAAGFFSGTTSVLLTALILHFFADHSNQDGGIPEGTRPWGWGGPTHAQDGKHSKCTIFHTKCHFSCPKGIIFLSPVPCTNELFLLHFPTVSLPLLSLPAWLQCSFTCLRRPGDGHLQELLHSCNMPSFRFYRAAIKKTKYISKLISQIIYAAVLNKIRSILCTKLKASLSCKIERPVISIP